MADTLLGGIAINEVLVDPNGALNFDTDGNGVAEATDEFVELVNTSSSAIDISGLELWDAGAGNYFTFPPGTVLQPGGHALVQTGVGAGGSLPATGPDDWAFDAGRGTAVFNNTGDNIIVYDPANDEYIAATYNGDTPDDPTAGAAGYSGFSATATQSGSGEDMGNDTDGESLQRGWNLSEFFTSGEPTPADTNICFLGGTLFDTPTGPRAVEDLAPGDLINTLDHGPQPVTWVYAQPWTPQQVAQRPTRAPVVIAQGALGNGLPRRALRVSQHHRIMVQGPIAARMFGASEVLVAAKHLTALPGVTIELPKREIAYHHVMLGAHQVLLAEGLPAESLYLGRETIRAIPQEGLREISALLGLSLPALLTQTPRPARQFARGHRARSLIERHSKNAKPLAGQSSAA
ncbi:Hint domain-containing protein [Alphaproteobacteria bacterium KMM 3653]|uniref:Hint domain-containing protein n=1 Tax=Harenicola maris TaxID=2841044 RepID=A0AAP2CXT0_9RHOB|nr:Hint domain-containing protein [Harenicola maris]